jgi:GT2 family glycosyltransferase
MFIDVRIPWEPGKRLGYACNRMFNTVDDWGLILDWDVMLLNIKWYDICLKTIVKVGHNAGLISCVTNRIGCPLQKYGLGQSDNIDENILIASEIAKKYEGKIDDVTDKPNKLSGMFFLTRRKVWDEVGGVPDEKFIGMDNYYHDRVKEAGYKIYIMKDLYVFHNYRRQWKE